MVFLSEWLTFCGLKTPADRPLFPYGRIRARLRIESAGRRRDLRRRRVDSRSPGSRTKPALMEGWGITSARRGHPVCERLYARAPYPERRPSGTAVGGRSPLARATFRVAVSMRRRRQDEAGGQEIAELAALADGSLAPERRAALEARVAASPELADRLAEQQRAVALARSAANEVEAPAALRARIEAQRRARRVPAPRRLVLIGAAATAALGRRHRGGRRSVRSPRPSASTPRSQPTEHGARRQGRGDAHQDILGLADRARRHGASPPRGRALLRGVATQRRGRARSDRDVQREPEGHALGGRVAEGLPDADRHARAGRRRSDLVGREGAGRNGRHRRRVDAAGGAGSLEPPSIRRTTCWRAR